MKNIACVLVSLLFSLHIVTGKEYKLYYLGGQSNMDGMGYVADLPEELNAPVEGVMIFHGNTAPDNAEIDGRGIWSELRPGHGRGFECDGVTNTYSDRFGVELTFARRLVELSPMTNIALVKYSRGGTSIDQEAARKFGSWDPDYGDSTGVNQYDHFLSTLRNAFSVKDIDGDGKADHLIPSGILWMQGESDAYYSEEVARRYEANLKRLMDLMRAAFRIDDLPVVIGRISDSGQDADGKVWDFGQIVREAQSLFVEKDGHAALVTSTDHYRYSDRYHYSSEGYIDLGKKFAESVAEFEQR